jgi:multisubunit Na+/H+ antiporter MnhB subunit
MSAALWVLDILLCGSLVWLGCQALLLPDLYRATASFIVFGVMVVLTWARLQAPDLALAEAAIGAGITGALLLSIVAVVSNTQAATAGAAQPEHGAERGTSPSIRNVAECADRRGKQWCWNHALIGVPIVLLVPILGVAILSLPAEAVGLADSTREHSVRAGATNLVTAVLLNYRSYDTLLEIAVLLVAVLAERSLVGESNRSGGEDESFALLRGFVRVVAPLMVVMAGYVLWVGSYEPGGAFQAGCLLASLGVLLGLSGLHTPHWLRPKLEDCLLVLGLAVFLLVGTGVMLLRRNFLEYPPEAAKTLILWIEAAGAISIGVILAALFVGGRLADSPRREERRC